MNNKELINYILINEYRKFNADYHHIQKIMNLSNKQKLLDLGAGFGRALEVTQHYPSYYMVEPNEFFVNELVSQYGEDYKKNLFQNKLNELKNFENNFKGIMVLMNAIAEMSPIFQSLSKIALLLKEGGYLLFYVQNPLYISDASIKHGVLIRNNYKVNYTKKLYRDENKGPNSFYLQFDYQNSSEPYKIYQTLPTLSSWIQMLEYNNLRIVELTDNNNESCSDKSIYFRFLVKKNTSKKTSTNKIENLYNNLNESYTCFIKRLDYRVPSRIKNKLPELKIKNKDKILDIACADGYIGKILKRFNQSLIIHGIDLVDKFIDDARKSTFYDSVSKIDINKGLIIPDDSYYDVLIFTGTTEFALNIQNNLKDCNRILKIGGYLLITFPQHISKEEVNKDKITIQTYDENNIREYLKEAKFKIIDLQSGKGYRSQHLNLDVSYYFVIAKRDK
ncbi:MAG: class I SAM-dependent methyltransferase [Halobacteriovoraceae bacterium]|nr:class I SAM-dependent methyltransferase [Halobacteriovoraceae bacterium]